MADKDSSFVTDPWKQCFLSEPFQAVKTGRQIRIRSSGAALVSVVMTERAFYWNSTRPVRGMVTGSTHREQMFVEPVRLCRKRGGIIRSLCLRPDR